MHIDAVADRVSEAVARVVRAEQRSTDRRGILSLVHLVPRERLEEYAARISAVKAHAAERIILGAVRAPYSFTELNWVGAGHDSSSPVDND